MLNAIKEQVTFAPIFYEWYEYQPQKAELDWI